MLRPGGRLVVSTHHPTADWLRQGGSYFTMEAIEETWNQEWSARYWRLPLTATCAEFTAGSHFYSSGYPGSVWSSSLTLRRGLHRTRAFQFIMVVL